MAYRCGTTTPAGPTTFPPFLRNTLLPRASPLSKCDTSIGLLVPGSTIAADSPLLASDGIRTILAALLSGGGFMNTTCALTLVLVGMGFGIAAPRVQAQGPPAVPGTRRAAHPCAPRRSTRWCPASAGPKGSHMRLLTSMLASRPGIPTITTSGSPPPAPWSRREPPAAKFYWKRSARGHPERSAQVPRAHPRNRMEIATFRAVVCSYQPTGFANRPS